jgi:hypothetical protein
MGAGLRTPLDMYVGQIYDGRLWPPCCSIRIGFALLC